MRFGEREARGVHFDKRRAISLYWNFHQQQPTKSRCTPTWHSAVRLQSLECIFICGQVRLGLRPANVNLK